MFARITISGTSLAQRAAEDCEIERRLSVLSPKHREKARRRIQGQRFGRLIAKEMQGVIEDLKRNIDFYQGSTATVHPAPTSDSE